MQKGFLVFDFCFWCSMVFDLVFDNTLIISSVFDLHDFLLKKGHPIFILIKINRVGYSRKMEKWRNRVTHKNC